METFSTNGALHIMARMSDLKSHGIKELDLVQPPT